MRVYVMAASVPERQGGKKVLQQVHHIGKAVSRLHTIWTDGGFDGGPFMQWVITVCRWLVARRVAARANQRVCGAEKAFLSLNEHSVG